MNLIFAPLVSEEQRRQDVHDTLAICERCQKVFWRLMPDQHPCQDARDLPVDKFLQYYPL